MKLNMLALEHVVIKLIGVALTAIVIWMIS